MKKLLSSLLLAFGILPSMAQSYQGYFYDNYAGVQSALFNPANIVDSRFKTDINLISVSAFGANDYLAVKPTDIFKSTFNFDTQATKSPKFSNNGNVNVDIMGPSFMFNITKNHSIAIFTRARVIANAFDVNGALITDIATENNGNLRNFEFSNQNFNVKAHAWGELGLTYAFVLYQNGAHFLKGGVTAKYLQGAGNAFLHASNLSVKFNETPDINTSLIQTTGNVSYGTSQDTDKNFEFKLEPESRGFGFDFGLVYEWRPEFNNYLTTDVNGNVFPLKNKNKYKLKAGLSVTDLGSINYKNGVNTSYNMNATITQADLEAQDGNISNILKNLYIKENQLDLTKAGLPTAIHANVDYHLHNKFYLNLNTDLSLISKSATNTNRIVNTVMLAPRYETNWFTFYTPLSWNELSGFQAGSGLRFGPLFVGSSTVLTNLFAKQSKAVDVHVGLKIPVYQGEMRDTDGDGVYDKVDACKDVPGPAENFGCPWPDTDGDGLLDKDDKCPTVAGPKENKGCPWPDTDKDGVLDKDDKCPTVAGPKDNFGCPWPDTDGDGVLDKDDKCPNEKGTVANNGCPEVVVPVMNQEVEKQISTYSRTIFFENGKSVLKTSSYASLDNIYGVMNEYKTATFRIGGHTDNVGNAAANLKLSQQRANAVKKYLVDKGIAEDRLIAEGYGPRQPIASNKTAKGRTTNRRVEIKLNKQQ